MLVCNISLRPARGAIAVEIAEVVEATDASASGQVVFATLVDDPAAVGDSVDAFFGDLMLEAASAADAVDVGLGYTLAIDEAATAGDAQNVIAVSTYNVTLDEAAAAVSDTDATVTAASSYNTWNTSDKSANTSVAGLTVTTTTTSAGGIRSTGFKTAGKIYFEITWTGSPSAARHTCGIQKSSTGLTNLDVNGATVRTDDGFIRINGAVQASVGAFASGDVAGIAFDLGVSRAWFRRNGGNWNNSGTANPATNTGGYDISAMFPTSSALAAIGTGASTAMAATANFGATTFAFTVPSGFTGWTVP